jgi:hypothetical protein
MPDWQLGNAGVLRRQAEEHPTRAEVFLQILRFSSQLIDYSIKTKALAWSEVSRTCILNAGEELHGKPVTFTSNFS